jgi:hypothetical protein
MRLWSLHPQYLDTKGLLAVWREGLLAQHVLAGKTRGYKNHPQLARFKRMPDPLVNIGAYLTQVVNEADRRGYAFARDKILRSGAPAGIMRVTRGQMAYEWAHLLRKLEQRSPEVFKRWQTLNAPQPHPLFEVVEGEVEEWEKAG